MENPWNKIPLADYESHMKLDSVMQLQAMNHLMKGQFEAYPASSVMILGVAGGNGLEHLARDSFDRVYGVDVNPSYLEETARRYLDLDGVLECLCVDLTRESGRLPHAELVIANLLIEYIGCECFQQVIGHVDPKYVSCVIQINPADHWVSDSPYLHVFDGLERIHHEMDEQTLRSAMAEIRYLPVRSLEHPLPNGKKLVQIDFRR